MSTDPALYSLVMENNRMLKALTERLTPKQPDSSRCGPECSDPRGLHALADVMGGTANPHDLVGLNSVVRGNPKSPTEPDMQHVLKTGSLPPQTKAEASLERAVRSDIAERLLSILFPGPAQPNLDLDGCLREIERLRHWTRETERQGRDAALEEAAATAAALIDERDSHAVCARADTIAKRIRALKSKSAPLDLGLTPEEDDEIISSGGGFSHLSGQTTQAGPAPEEKPIMDCSTGETVQCLVPGCDKPHQHEGPHSGGGAPVITEETLRTLRERRETRADVGRQIDALATSDVHDFGWALAQMRAGKKVRRKGSATPAVLDSQAIDMGWVQLGRGRLSWESMSATDWEVAE